MTECRRQVGSKLAGRLQRVLPESVRQSLRYGPSARLVSADSPARAMASCRGESAEWCGAGQCVEVREAGNETSGWRCDCDSGWRSTYLSIEAEQPRCELQISVMRAFLVFWVIVSALLLAVQVQAVLSRRLDKRRGFVFAFSCALNLTMSVVGLLVPANARLSPRASKLFFPVVSLSVILYGVLGIIISIDKYLKVVRATAQGIMLGKRNKRYVLSQEKLSPETFVVILRVLTAWALCCVLWFALALSARSCWAVLFMLVGFAIGTSTLCSHRTISALDRELRKSESEQGDCGKADDTSVALRSSTAAMGNKMRRLRAKLARTHRSIIVPGLITIVVDILCVYLVAAADSMQRFEYSIQVWYAVYLGTLYGQIAHHRALRRARVDDSRLRSLVSMPRDGVSLPSLVSMPRDGASSTVTHASVPYVHAA